MKLNKNNYAEHVNTDRTDPTIVRPIATTRGGRIFISGISVPEDKLGKRCRIKIEWVEDENDSKTEG